ncbi:MAG: hypothetical protein P8K78_00525 [Pirellulales bacterium]|nr:hypothetical protein [Pirellulales bacterium]
MATDLFDHLAEENVPELPGQFDQEVHSRLNRTLLTFQLFEIFINTFPWFLKYFGSAVVGAIFFTVTGKYHKTTNNTNEDNPRRKHP